MARSIEQIQNIILEKKALASSLSNLEVLTTSEQSTLANLTSTSKVAIWRLWVYICAFSIWTLEKIYDTFKIEVEETIALNQIGTPTWYRKKMLEFQLGYDLTEMAIYDNTNEIQSEVLESKIIKQAAIEEIGGRLKVKVATENTDGELAPLSNAELEAFSNYAQKIKYAGTRLIIVSRIPDDFKADYTIYYNPLILDAYGARLDGTDNEPVQNAVKSFLRNLEFNGELVLTKLTDYLQEVEGVEEPVKNAAQAKYGGFGYNEIDEYYIADAGYMKLDTDNTTFEFLAREL
ncbi:nucleotidyltransferase [Flavobacterium phage vB_FspM_pippi8-1]|uniref:Nucleotidyltransferase n=1 Tax=Flavobacterium phage vB_FspM_pippi8-1 TaxID=2686244 RepID=A0A6B9LFG2_9CAUD|nr:nucleotidyltransferase [Flavobacterium phage vB_FspM_pippi8-1]QHB38611.1 nucleotidyltransferase [Flavobacterium phage vB_FspM_pippi8-1]